MKAKLFKYYIWLAFLGALSCSVPPDASDSQLTRGRVQIKEGTIVTDKGSLLRGIFVSSDLSPTIPSKADIAKIKSYGLNTIHLYAECASRVPVPGGRVAQVDSIISWAETEGLYVIMTIGGCDVSGTFDVDFIRGFWEFYAPRYKDKTHVIYEIMNEPDWQPPYKDDNLAMQLMTYDLIRKHAPDTHVQLLGYSIPVHHDSAMIDLKKIHDRVDWSNASIATHGYATTTDNFKAFITNLKKEGYAIAVTEPEAINNQYLNAVTTRIFEEEFVSYTHFVPVANVLNKPEKYIDIIEHKHIRWEPDFGTWPQDVPLKDYRLDARDTIYAGFFDKSYKVKNIHATFGVGSINNGSYLSFENLAFTTLPTSFEATCASGGLGGEIEVRLDSLAGPLVSTCKIPVTKDWKDYQTFSSAITNFGAIGIHDVYFIFRGGEGQGLMNVERFQFRD